MRIWLLCNKRICWKGENITARYWSITGNCVEDEFAIEQAEYYSQFCDTLILDSVDRNINGIGAAGFINDWDIDAEIVKRAKCKVILAGGLSPDNVKEAILKVKPWGVDSFTKTSDILPDGTSRKNKEKVKAFVQNAKEAFAIINK